MEMWEMGKICALMVPINQKDSGCCAFQKEFLVNVIGEGECGAEKFVVSVAEFRKRRERMGFVGFGLPRERR